MSQDRARKGSEAKKDKDYCGKCDKECTEGQPSLTCDMCGLWHHSKCEGVNQQAYKAIEAGASVGVKWFCRKCDKYARPFMTSLQKLSERQEVLEGKMEAMEENVQNKFEQCNEKIDQVEERLLGQAVAESAREIKERETRKIT